MPDRLSQLLSKCFGFLAGLLRRFGPVRWLYHEMRYWHAAWSHRISARWNWRTGVTTTKREPELIISLTSIPERIATLHLCLDSLLCQSTKPDRLILWLSESTDPSRPMISRDNLPDSLTRLKKRGLEIRWCKDIRSFRKIVPTLRAYPDALVVTADDDILYPRKWLEHLYTAYQCEPQYVHCHLAHHIKYESDGKPLPYSQWDTMTSFQGPSLDLFPTVGGGALFAPGHLHKEMLNEDSFLKLCPLADDVWMKAMTLLNRVQVKTVAKRCFTVISIRIEKNRCLHEQNIAGGQNDHQISAVNGSYSCFGASPR